MRKIQIMGLAIVAVFAFSAFAVSSAFAHEWLVNKVAVATEATVKQSGTLVLNDMGSKVSLECTGTGEGKVLAAGKDTVTAAKATGCIVLEGSCPTPSANPVHLPWNTELTTVGTELRDNITNSGAGEPGWTVTCLGIIKDECTGPSSTKITNNLTETPVDVTSTFDEGSAPAHCSLDAAGTKEGLVTGGLLTVAEGGVALEAS
jgi:methionine-rich copper-binding protein CopC